MRFDDRVTGNLQDFAPNAKMIHVDIDPAEIGKNVPGRRGASSATCGTLQRADCRRSAPSATRAWLAEIARLAQDDAATATS